MIYIWYLWQRFTNLLFIVINVIQILLVWLFCTKMSNTEKTKRCSNFTKEEERILTQLVHKNRNIIECKKSGQVTWEQKANTWRTIADEFNSTVGGHFKGVQILKCKYANLKKKLQTFIFVRILFYPIFQNGLYVPLKLFVFVQAPPHRRYKR